MKTRLEYLLKEETISDAQTKLKEIDVTEAITRLDILYEATNGATSCTDHEIHDDVTKIELVNGSDELESLSMIEWQALNCFESRGFPWHSLSEAAAAVQKEMISINFGRYYGDPELAFVAKNFNAPQLKLTHALAISATVGFATGTGKVTVIAHMIDDPSVTPRGFLMAKEPYSWTTVASGDEAKRLPRDYPWRLLMVKGLLSTYRLDEVITHLKLSMDAGKFVPIDIDTDHLAQLNALQFGPFRQIKQLLRADAAAAELDLYDLQSAYLNSLADLNIANAETLDAEQITTQVLILAVTPTIAKASTAVAIKAKTVGYQPHACVVIPFGDLQQPNTWLPASEWGSIELKATQGTASGAAAFVLQQLRSY